MINRHHVLLQQPPRQQAQRHLTEARKLYLWAQACDYPMYMYMQVYGLKVKVYTPICYID